MPKSLKLPKFLKNYYIHKFKTEIIEIKLSGEIEGLKLLAGDYPTDKQNYPTNHSYFFMKFVG